MNKHTLPDLPYDYKALEPYIDSKTMEIHHTKHHGGYVAKLNTALEQHSHLFEVPLESLLANISSIPDEIRLDIRNNGGGHLNHSLFWKILTSSNDESSSGNLVKAITKRYTSIDAFKSEFEKAAAKRFGSGWAWLSLNAFKELVIHSTANQDSPLLDGLIPIIGLDVWEHAYYLNYQNRRPDYISAFWKILNWQQAEVNYKNALTNIDTCLSVADIRKAS